MALLNSLLIEAAMERCRKGTVEDAVLLASYAFYGHRDINGEPYICHAIHVMNRVRRHGHATMITAVLMDLETVSPVIDEGIYRRFGFGTEIIEALRLLKRSPDETCVDTAHRLCEEDVALPHVQIALRVFCAACSENVRVDFYVETTDAVIEAVRLQMEALRLAAIHLSKVD